MFLSCIAFTGAVLHAAETWYVDVANTGKDDLTGKTEAAAFPDIQSAIDKASAGDTIKVKPGIYASGEKTDSLESRNRVLITKKLTLCSSTGERDSVVVVGAKTAGATYGCGEGSIRCIGVEEDAAGSVIQGFLLRDGSTNTGSDSMAVSGGGIVYLSSENESSPGTYLVDSTIKSCSATRGGGNRGVTMIRCMVEDCWAIKNGAACRGCRAMNTIFKNNGTEGAIFAYMERGLLNCTVVQDKKTVVFTGTTRHVINSLFIVDDDCNFGAEDSAFTNCAATVVLPEVGNNIKFVLTDDVVTGPAVDDYRLRDGSEMIGSGNVDLSGTKIDFYLKNWNDKDFYGNSRFAKDGKISIGAVESVGVPVAGKMIFTGVSSGGNEYKMTVDGKSVSMRNDLKYVYPTQWPTQYLAGVQNVPQTHGVMRYDMWIGGESSQARTPPSIEDDTLWIMPHPTATKEIKPNLAVVRYVDASRYGMQDSNGETVDTAYGTIQDAIDAGQQVVIKVLPGVYDKGCETVGLKKDGADIESSVMKTRVYVGLSNYRIVSTKGPERTFIVGEPDLGSENGDGVGPNAVRCVCMQYQCALQGFTLTRSYPKDTVMNEYSAPFVGPSARANAFLADSIVSNNYGYSSIFNATAVRTMFRGNRNIAQVVRSSIVANCIFQDNIAERNSHNNSYLFNCTVYERCLTNKQMFATSGTKHYNNIYHSKDDVDGGQISNMGGCLFYKVSYANTKAGASAFTSSDLFACEDTRDFRLLPDTDAFTCGTTSHLEFSTYATGDFYGNPYVYTDEGLPAAGAVHTRLPCATRYVSAENGHDDNDGLSENTPKRTLAAALSESSPLDTVKVAPGVYEDGSQIHAAKVLDSTEPTHSSRAVIPSRVTLEATGSKHETIIDGNEEIRCITAYSKSEIRGFTLRGGRTLFNEEMKECDDFFGGGVLAKDGSVVVSDCIITNCHAMRGGGSYLGSYRRCIFRGNGATKNASSGREGFYYGCVFGGALNKMADLYFPKAVQSCTFMSETKPILQINDNIEVVNSLFCAEFANDRFPANIRLINCAYPNKVTTSFAVDPVNCVVVPIGQLQVDEEGRPTIGSNAAIDAGDESRYDRNQIGEMDLAGNGRIANGQMDIGAYEADWRDVYAASLGRASVLTVTDASSLVAQSGSSVKIPSGALTVAIDLGNSIHKNGRFRFRVVGAGTLFLYSDGGETPVGRWTADDGDVEYITNLGDGTSWSGKFEYVRAEEETDGGAYVNGIDLARGTSIVIR